MHRSIQCNERFLLPSFGTTDHHIHNNKIHYHYNHHCQIKIIIIIMTITTTISINITMAFMAFNCVTGCAPDSLTDQFIKRSDVSTHTTRNSQKLQIPLLNSATGQRSFYHRTAKIWNTLDPSLKLRKPYKNSNQN